MYLKSRNATRLSSIPLIILDPGESVPNSFEVENIGNTEWTVTANAQSLDGGRYLRLGGLR